MYWTHTVVTDEPLLTRTTVTHTHGAAYSHSELDSYTHSLTHTGSLFILSSLVLSSFSSLSLCCSARSSCCHSHSRPSSSTTVCRLSSSPPDQRPHFIQAILNLTTASWYNILCMAHQEMTVVSVLPVDTIRAHLHKLVFYYGVGDQWNTPELCPRIQQLFPQGDITLCRHGYKHDFVLESANEMAEYCCDKMTSWIMCTWLLYCDYNDVLMMSWWCHTL